MPDRGDEQGGVAVVQAGDGVAEVEGMALARLAKSRRMQRSPPEQGRPLLFRTVTLASQLMEFHRSVATHAVADESAAEASRCRNVPLLVSRATPASRG